MRLQLRLTLFYRIVEGLIPVLPPEKFLQQQKPGRQIHTRQLDGKSDNPDNNYAKHNDRPYVVTHCNTEEQKNSFFPRTTVNWNRLKNSVVHANSVESFKTLVAKAKWLCAAQAPLHCNNAKQLDVVAYFNKNKNIKHNVTGQKESHPYKLEKLQGPLDVTQNFFSRRVFDWWNDLPCYVVFSPSVNSFKNQLDRYLRDLKFDATFPLKLLNQRGQRQMEDITRSITGQVPYTPCNDMWFIMWVRTLGPLNVAPVKRK